MGGRRRWCELFLSGVGKIEGMRCTITSGCGRGGEAARDDTINGSETVLVSYWKTPNTNPSSGGILTSTLLVVDVVVLLVWH